MMRRHRAGVGLVSPEMWLEPIETRRLSRQQWLPNLGKLRNGGRKPAIASPWSALQHVEVTISKLWTTMPLSTSHRGCVCGPAPAQFSALKIGQGERRAFSPANVIRFHRPPSRRSPAS